MFMRLKNQLNLLYEVPLKIQVYRVSLKNTFKIMNTDINALIKEMIFMKKNLLLNPAQLKN